MQFQKTCNLYNNSILQVCPTYPSVLVVPKLIDDQTIILSAKFRDGGRFPVLSYRHRVGVCSIYVFSI